METNDKKYDIRLSDLNAFVDVIHKEDFKFISEQSVTAVLLFEILEELKAINKRLK